MSLDELLYLIEEMREKLNRIAVQRSLIDPEVIKLSQIIDSLLNLYHNTLSQPV
ncbi:aspartyl-phosphate phosphatase Spo0E family protein [Desulfosporosinus sp. FKA]|uniref:aspartyl-phosphate phosphatase Spo0E family protein n=1 Tax=Desulfosporosinus sp. FKA TaxID=1969834 RepID=UPI000B49E9FD|nr:aspartyl-phosphate phosphatase Spo0E family protein [Desulfosporosinus sp. FKA]